MIKIIITFNSSNNNNNNSSNKITMHQKQWHLVKRRQMLKAIKNVAIMT